MKAAAPSRHRADFVVDRRDLRRCQFVHDAPSSGELAPGQVLLRVDKFGFTSNNLTYALLGDSYGFWCFFPAPDGWGRIPVWGFADVVRSAHDAVAEGERFWGYYPMSSHLVMQPGEVASHGFVETSPHRRGLRAFYNRYTRSQRQSGDGHQEDLQILLRPLFMTAFMLHDLLAEHDFFGAQAVILSSASSKLALGLSFLLSRIRGAVGEVIGLTSAEHVRFVEGAGHYSKVIPYDAVGSLPRDMPVAIMDIAGDASILRSLHHHFGDAVKFSGNIGFSHWDRRGGSEVLPGARPTPFFVLDQSERRAREWGLGELQRRFAEVWIPFEKMADRWLNVERKSGESAVVQVYLDMLAKRLKPADGHILSV